MPIPNKISYDNKWFNMYYECESIRARFEEDLNKPREFSNEEDEEKYYCELVYLYLKQLHSVFIKEVKK